MTATDITLIVLAGGLATRYGGNKQLESVGPSGEVLLEYALFDAWRAGCRRAVLLTRADLAPVLEREVAAHWRGRLGIDVAVQHQQGVARPVPPRRRPWGTGHALLAATGAVPGPVLVCNADDFYGRSAYAAALSLVVRGIDGLAGYPLGDTLSPHGGVSRAICHTGEAGRLLRIEERTGIIQRDGVIADDRGDAFPAGTPVSMNLWAFRPSFLRQLEPAFDAFLATHGGDENAELRIADVVMECVAAGTDFRVVGVAEQWFGLTYAADLATVREQLAARVAAGEYPVNLRAV